MKIAEAQSGQPFSLPLARLGYGIGICLTVFVSLIAGTDWQAGLVLAFVLAYALLICFRIEWGIYAIVAFVVIFIDGWAPTRSPEDVVFRVGFGRIYVMEFAIYGLLLFYLIRRALADPQDSGQPLFVSTPFDTPLITFAALLPAFAIYGLAQGNPLQDAFGYFEWRSLFLGIVFYFLITTIIRNRENALRLFDWFLALVVLKAAYFLFIYVLHLEYPFPNIFGPGPMDEGPENIMFVFVGLAAFSFLVFRFRKSWAIHKYAVVAVVVLLANVELSAKRTAQLGIVVSVLFLFWRFPARQKLRFGFQLTAGVLVMILLLGAIGSNPGTADLGRSASRYDEVISFVRNPQEILSLNGTLAFHILDLYDAWNVIKERPLLGYGFGSHYDREYTLLPGVGGEGADLEPGVVHSQYLHIWWKMGILGLGAYLWLQLRIFRFGAKMLHRVPSSAPYAIALGLFSALIGDVAMEVLAPQWFESTKVSLLIFLSLALIVCLVKAGGEGRSVGMPVSPYRPTEKDRLAAIEYKGEPC